MAQNGEYREQIKCSDSTMTKRMPQSHCKIENLLATHSFLYILYWTFLLYSKIRGCKQQTTKSVIKKQTQREQSNPEE